MKTFKFMPVWGKLSVGTVLVWLLMFMCGQAVWAAPPGPGGVGTTDGTSSLRLWFYAGAGVYRNVDCDDPIVVNKRVACWEDQSGHGERVIQSEPDYQPIYRTSKPNLEFNTNILTATQALSLFATADSGLTTIVVFDMANYTHTGVLVNHGVVSSAFELGYGFENAANYGLQRGVEDATVALSGTLEYKKYAILSTLVLTSSTQPTDSVAIYKDGMPLTLTTNGAGWLEAGEYPTATVPWAIGARRTGVVTNAFHSGNIVEIIVYTKTLNTVERVLIENSLNVKYSLKLTAAPLDKYNQTTYKYDVAGIGRELDGSHTVARSAGLMVEDAGFLENVGDYMLFGHNQPSNEIKHNLLPAGVSERWKRLWYFKLTGREAGNVTLSFDFSEAGFTETPNSLYALLGRSVTTGYKLEIVQTSSEIVGDRVIFRDTPVLKDGWSYTLGKVDSFDYYVKDSKQLGGITPNFVDILMGTEITTTVTFTDQNTITGPVPISFAFNFYDVTYNEVYISPNGYLTFLDVYNKESSATHGNPLAGKPGIIAGWWNDLDIEPGPNSDGGGGSVHYAVRGVTPNRQFVLQYTDVELDKTAAPTATFQIILHESSNVIEMQYLQATSMLNDKSSVGIENQDGSKGVQYYYADDALADFAVRYSPPKLLVDNTVNDLTPRVGELITYTLVVRSNLTESTTAVVITDTLDTGLLFATEFVTMTPALSITFDFVTQTLMISDFNLKAGKRVTFTIPVTVQATVEPGTQLFNRTTLTQTELTQMREDSVSIIADNCWVRIAGKTPVYNQLQEALDVAASGATVKIAGHCLNVLKRDKVQQVGYVTKTLTLQGGYRPGTGDWSTRYSTETTTLNAQGNGRVLYLTKGVSMTVDTLHIVKGDAAVSDSANKGGGLYAISGTLTLSNTWLHQNVADTGGGLYLEKSTLDLKATHIYTNAATTLGGGVYAVNSAITMTHGTLTSNEAGSDGGGGYLKDVTLHLNASRVADNLVTSDKGQGGGLYGIGGSFIFTHGVSLEGNRAVLGGGAYLDAVDTLMYNSEIVSNTAEKRGAGLYTGAGTLDLRDDSVISYNEVQWTGSGSNGGGAGVYGDETLISIQDSTFVSNTANYGTANYGGAIALLDGTLVLTRNMFLRNTTSFNGGALYAKRTTTVTLFANRFEANAVASAVASAGGGVYLSLVPAMNFVTNTFVSNVADHGGAVYLKKSAGSVISNTVISNTADLRGGGISFDATTGMTVTKNEFRFNQGKNGGGVDLNNSTVYLADNRFVYNRASASGDGGDGGGIRIDKGNPVLEYNVIMSNTATARGGGVYFISSPTPQSVVFSNTIILNSTNGSGGGVYVNAAKGLVVSQNIVTGNTALKTGGGMALKSSVGVSITENILKYNVTLTNTSGGGGGGIYAEGSRPVVEDNQVISNTAYGDGGGLFLKGPSGVVRYNKISENFATGQGGGIKFYNADWTVMSNTVQLNSALLSGGGIFLDASKTEMAHNSVLTNTAGTAGGGVYVAAAAKNSKLRDNIIAGNVVNGTAEDKIHGGGGLYLRDPENIILTENAVYSNTAVLHGGGLYVYQGEASAVITNNVISHNIAQAPTSNGGGVYFLNAVSRFEDNSVRENMASGQGGGIYLYQDKGTKLNSNFVIANTANGNGGGMASYKNLADTMLTNMVIAANTTTFITATGSGMYVHVAGKKVDLLHSTFVENSGGDHTALVVVNPGVKAGSVELVNTILVSHTLGISVAVHGEVKLDATLWYGNGQDIGGAGAVTSRSNLYAPPDFVDSTAHDYHLLINSPAIDVGVASDAVRDFEGDTRPQYDVYDLGADEYAGTCFATLNASPWLYDNIQSAVNVSTQAADVVKVAGTCDGGLNYAGFNQAAYITKSLTLRGGYTFTDWANLDPIANPTVVRGVNAGRVFVISGDGVSVTLENLNIDAGNAAVSGGTNQGGALYVNGATVAVLNSRIADSTAVQGGGVYVTGSAALSLSDSEIMTNTASNGAGLYLQQGVVTLTNNLLQANTAITAGGAVYIASAADVVLEDSHIQHNAAAHGGGIYVSQNSPTIRRTLIVSNTAQHGGGIYLDDSAATLVNNVVADNVATGLGSGVFAQNSGLHFKHTTFARNVGGEGSGLHLVTTTAFLTNTIIVRHTVGITVAASSAVTVNTTLWGADEWANVNNLVGSGTNINSYTGDPKFVDPAHFNYHIGKTSAAINQGRATDVLVDIDNWLRDQIPDLGADEYRTCWVRLNDDPTDYAVVQKAVQASTQSADVVKIAGYCAGVSAYPPQDIVTTGLISQVVYLTKTLTLQGGYTTTNFTVPYPATQPTVLDAVGAGRVIYASGNVAPTIAGLWLVGGTATGLGGYTAGDAGGGVYAITASVTLNASHIVSNSSAYGGALHVSAGMINVWNTVIAQNQATQHGAALHSWQATVHGVHTTIAENSGGDGAALYLDGGSNAQFANSIVVSHTVGVVTALNSGSTAAFTATLWANDTNRSGNAIAHTGNVAGDAAFVAPESDDYHIGVYSAAIDRGVTTAGAAVDFDGEARPVGQGYDLGADEYPAAIHMTKMVEPVAIVAGEFITYTLFVTNTGHVELHAYINDSLPDDVTPNAAQHWEVLLPVNGAPWSRTITVRVVPDYTGRITNTGWVTTARGVEDLYTLSVNVSAESDLAISKVRSAADVPPHTPLTYTLTYINNGPSTAVGVVLTDIIPAEILSVTLDIYPSLTPITETTYAWDVGTLAPQAGGVITISGVLSTGLPGGMVITNSAQITTTSTFDDDAGNNTSGPIEITVLDVSPEAEDDVAAILEDSVANIAVLDNDSDLNGDTLSVVNVSTATHGATVILSDSILIYTPMQNYNGPDAFTYRLTDGANFVTANVTVTVAAVNDAPIATPDIATTLEDTAVIIPVLANDSDVESVSLSLSAVGTPVSGTVVISGTELVYTPLRHLFGVDTFTYVVTDGDGVSATTLVTVTVTPVNDAPMARDDIVATDEDAARRILVLANDTDVEGTPLILSAVGSPFSGTVTRGGAILNGTTVIYTPALGFAGPDTFTYTVSDGELSAWATVTVNVQTESYPPVGVDDVASTAEDIPIILEVVGNDTDVDNDPLYIAAVNAPDRATTDGMQITYTPPPDFVGLDTFTYSVSDGLMTDTARISVTMTPVNDAPEALGDGYLLLVDTTLSVAAPGVLVNDNDIDSHALTALVESGPVSGNLVLSADGALMYTPTVSFVGVDGFTYVVSDGTLTATAWVSLTVVLTDTPPVATADAYRLMKNTPLAVPAPGVLTNDTDADGDALTVLVESGPLSGNLVLDSDGAFNYTPNTNFEGADMFTYVVSDGVLTATAWVSLTVVATNDAPVATADAYRLMKNTPLTVAAPGVLENDMDDEALTIVASSAPLSGTLILSPDGALVYTPNSDFTGVDGFTYVVSDGILTATAWVSLTVVATNDAPVATADAYLLTMNAPPLSVSAPGILANDTDADGNVLTAVLNTAVLNGMLALRADGAFVYTPTLDFTGIVTFTYAAFDGITYSNTALVRFNIGAANLPPIAEDATVTTDESSPIAATIVADDPNDGDTLTYTLLDSPLYGALTLTESVGSWYYTPANRLSNYVDIFRVEVSDGSLTATARVTVNVTADNDKPIFTVTPVASGGETKVAIGTPCQYTFIVNDPEGSSELTLAVVAKPDWLSVTSALNLSGTPAVNPKPAGSAQLNEKTLMLEGTPSSAAQGSNFVELRAYDGSTEATFTFTITVLPPTSYLVYLPLVLRLVP